MVDITKKVQKPPSKLNPKTPQISILDQIRNDPRYSPARSIDWFKAKIKEAGGNSPSVKNDLFKTTKENQVTKVLPGSMYMFKYTAKYHDELEYYDMFPCSIMFGLTDNGMTGINLHYLPYALRVRLLDKLLQIASSKNSKEQILKITWKFLNNAAKFPEVQHCVKRYLYSHVQSKLIRIPVDEWKICALLPVESFTKKSLSYVTRRTSQMIKK